MFIPISEPSITDIERQYVDDAMRSGWISSVGPMLRQFEERFAEFCDTKYAVSVSNCTVGLHLALIANGIGPGDEVIVPDFTFVATANAVVHSGATPVMVDILEDTLCIDPDAIKQAITPRTKAIIPVHLYGYPANMTEILDIADRHGLIVIEDAAEAHGAMYNGKKVGSLGQCGVFSFYGNKIMTCGEGGMITTNDDHFYERASFLRDHAMSPDRRYYHTDIGYNYRLTSLQAAVGLGQLDRIDDLLNHRKHVFLKYQAGLSGIPRLKLNPESTTTTQNVYWLPTVEIIGYTDEQRNDLMAQLKKRGIDSRPFFYPISQLPMFSGAKNPVTARVSERGINLPCYFALKDADIDRVCTAMTELLT